jgi:hypothetical protein
MGSPTAQFAVAAFAPKRVEDKAALPRLLEQWLAQID